jgi:hypothetical protein
MPYAKLAHRALGAMEPLAAQAFFVPEVAASFEAIGLNMFEGYFTARAAPMGVVDAAVVEAAFYTFNPKVVRRSLRFDAVTPEQATLARQRGAGEALRRLVGDQTLDEVVKLLRAAVDAAPVAGRPLFAGHRALAWPEDPYEATWHGANCLREFRGDGHIALLVAHGVVGLEAQVLHAGILKIATPEDSFLVRGHGWKPEDYAAAASRLAERGLADRDGQVTEAGLKLRAMIERETDHLAEAPLRELGEAASAALLERLAELSTLVLSEKSLPALSAKP